MLYHDYRTGRSVTDLLVFPCDAEPYECSYSPEYFAAHSEHVTLVGGAWSCRDNHTYREPFYGWQGVRS